jgi:carboxypeptidase PM20D1
MSLELTVEKNGGHSSMPEKETALDILSRAVIKIRDNPFDPSFSPSTRGFLAAVGPEMPFLQKIVFANTWLFESIVIGIYEQSPGGNAVIRTTAVPTIIHAGVKDNVVPSKAQAIVNFRLLPGDSAKLIIKKVNDLIDDDRVKVEPVGGFYAEASAVSPSDGAAYKLVEEVVHKTFDDVISAPFMMIGGTDSRHFEGISTNIIKFSPMIDPIGFHGIDERVSEESLQSTLWFYEQLLRADR